jgi:hypothetical protein
VEFLLLNLAAGDNRDIRQPLFQGTDRFSFPAGGFSCVFSVTPGVAKADSAIVNDIRMLDVRSEGIFEPRTSVRR